MIKRNKNIATFIDNASNNVFVYETISKSASLTQSYLSDGKLSNEPFQLANGITIFPRGENNDLPILIKTALEKNHIAPSINNKKLDLLFGEGIFLYENILKDGILKREYVHNKEIDNWLQSWDLNQYIRKCAVNFFSTNISVSKLSTTKSRLIGNKKFFNKIVSIDANNFAFEYTTKDDIEKVFIGDIDKLERISKHNVFNPNNPSAFSNPVIIAKLDTFGDVAYPKPSFYGTMNWINQSSNIPLILESLNKNSLNFKFHVKVPVSYWEAKEDMLKEQCKIKGEPYEKQMLIDLQDNIFEELSKMLTGVDNVGKFFTSDYFIDNYGNKEGWELDAVDLKVEDYVNTQLKVALHSDFAVASGMNLSPTLANLSFASGKLSSGSEQLYALKLHRATNNQIAEEIITSATNIALKTMFNTNLKIGFYHSNINAEEEVAPKDRL